VVADNVVSKEKTSARPIKKAEKDGKTGIVAVAKYAVGKGRKTSGKASRMRVELTMARIRRMRKLG
jgi:hypothetical protein